MIVKTLVEIPKGCQNKYEIDKETGKISLDRVLFSPMFYPCEYGYLEDTLALDGDPIDMLVFSTNPTFPGCYVNSRIIGMLYMVDDGDEDVKVISVCDNDPRFDHVNTLADLSPHVLYELKHFFETYKSLQNKVTEVKEYHDVSTAIKYIEEAKIRYKK